MAEPHVVIFRRPCPVCTQFGFDVVAVPKLATGEFYPQLAACALCGSNVEFKGACPMTISDEERASYVDG